MKDFQEFESFQRCRNLVRAVGDLVNRGTFSKDPALVYQLRKTMLSIYSNFGEGFERDGNREFAQFVSISKGSVGEIRAQLLYALDLGYLEREKFEQLNELGKEAAKYLGGLMRYLHESGFRGWKFNKDTAHGSHPASAPTSELRTRNREPGTQNSEPGTRNRERR
jgi:four helix bundle protein